MSIINLPSLTDGLPRSTNTAHYAGTVREKATASLSAAPICIDESAILTMLQVCTKAQRLWIELAFSETAHI